MNFKPVSDLQEANLCTNSFWESLDTASVPFMLLHNPSVASFPPF